jgi:hypothetical protein
VEHAAHARTTGQSFPARSIYSMARWLRTVETTTSARPITEPGRLMRAGYVAVDVLIVGPALWIMARWP